MQTVIWDMKFFKIYIFFKIMLKTPLDLTSVKSVPYLKNMGINKIRSKINTTISISLL